MGPENQAAVRQAAAKGLVVNASTESRSVAAAMVRRVSWRSAWCRLGIPLCAQADRPFVITFPAHGPRAAAAAAHCS